MPSSSSGAAFRALRTLERLVGRRQLWRLGRLLYLHARRDRNGDPAHNGEYALHRQLVALARPRTAPFTAVDVGGFTGYWSQHLIETCRDAGLADVRLVIFEPSGESRERLTARLGSVSHTYNVTVRADAVAVAVGHADFDARSDRVGNQSLLVEQVLGLHAGGSSIRVPVTTLAAAFEEERIGEADFVKSDTEGFDLKVIRGALPLLAARRIGVLQFEYNHTWVTTRSMLRDVFDLAADLPYRLCKIVPGGIECYDAWHPELETFFDANFLLVRDDLIAPLGVRAGKFDAYNTFGVVSERPRDVAPGRRKGISS